MLTMDQIHHIRALYYEQGMKISEIIKETGMDRKTITKYIDMTDFNQPIPIPTKEQQICPKLNPYKPLIDEWLTEDKIAPRKQRHTAKRVFKRLQKETYGFNCSYRLVAEYVTARKRELNLSKKEGYIPLEHYPGESQGDFGKADFYENGTLHSGKYFILSFPFSNAGYMQLNYGENMECLLEALIAIFEYIGGVPTEVWFDNTSTIVTNIIKGGGRDITERFIRFKEHYGFKAVFMNPESGWEKGNVECKVGYSRRNLLVPVPRFVSLADYNKQLLTECDADADREHYRHNQTIEELHEQDKKQLLPLPSVSFDTASYMPIHTNKWGKFILNKGCHEYSVSPHYADQNVWLKLTSSQVIVMDDKQHVIIAHNRLYGDKKQQSMEWLPYLKYIAKKPRSLKNSGIYDMMPENMRFYLDKCPSTERGQILRVLSELTDRTGFGSAIQTVNQAIQFQAVDADSLKNLYRRLYADIPQLPPLKSQAGVPNVIQMPVNLAGYDAFFQGGGAVGG